MPVLNYDYIWDPTYLYTTQHNLDLQILNQPLTWIRDIHFFVNSFRPWSILPVFAESHFCLIMLNRKRITLRIQINFHSRSGSIIIFLIKNVVLCTMIHAPRRRFVMLSGKLNLARTSSLPNYCNICDVIALKLMFTFCLFNKFWRWSDIHIVPSFILDRFDNALDWRATQISPL